METINDTSKLVAQAIECLKSEFKNDLPATWSTENNLKETIELLEFALVKLTQAM